MGAVKPTSVVIITLTRKHFGHRRGVAITALQMSYSNGVTAAESLVSQVTERAGCSCQTAGGSETWCRGCNGDCQNALWQLERHDCNGPVGVNA